MAVTKEKVDTEPMVSVFIPKDFRLTIDHSTVIDYKAGPRMIPKDHAEHWYSIANGVVEAPKA